MYADVKDIIVTKLKSRDVYIDSLPAAELMHTPQTYFRGSISLSTIYIRKRVYLTGSNESTVVISYNR